MRVLILTRKDILEYRGGDTVQIEKVMKSLKEGFPVDVDLRSSISADEIKAYDLIHFFGIYLVDEIFDYIDLCSRSKIPYAVSPVFWSSKEFNRVGQTGWKRLTFLFLGEELVHKLMGVRDGFQFAKLFQPSLWSKRKAVLENAKIILPNAEVEMKEIASEFGLLVNTPYLVVPNAVDKMFLEHEVGEKERKQIRIDLFGSDREFAICVANFNPRKNQLRLIKAAKKLNIPLLLIGNGPVSEINKLKAASKDDPNVKICKFVEQNELIKYYQAAKVHILPSWYDTPGLSSLEAAASGCNIVASNRGSTYEYFEGYASYCEPGSVDSIAEALRKEFSADRGKPGLKVKIRENYLWEDAAQMTYKGYETLLSDTGGGGAATLPHERPSNV